MKVILRSDITNVGRQGDVREVAPGFARNYLIPRSLAMEATSQNLKLWEREKVKLEKERDKIIIAAKELADKMEKLTVTITVKVGDAGRLFGSVSNAMIANFIKENGLEVERHSILLPEPIKELGVYTVDVRIHPEVIAKVKVCIVEKKSTLHAAAEEPETPAEEAREATEEEQK